MHPTGRLVVEELLQGSVLGPLFNPFISYMKEVAEGLPTRCAEDSR